MQNKVRNSLAIDELVANGFTADHVQFVQRARTIHEAHYYASKVYARIASKRGLEAIAGIISTGCIYAGSFFSPDDSYTQYALAYLGAIPLTATVFFALSTAGAARSSIMHKREANACNTHRYSLIKQ